MVNLPVKLPLNTKYESRNWIIQLLIRQFMNSLLDLVSVAQPFTILDVGAGEGLVPRHLMAAGPSYQITAVDIGRETLQVALRLAPELRCIEGDIYNLPFLDASYDLVICTELFEHLLQPSQAIGEVARVSRRYCLFSVPNEPWWRLANMLRGSYWQHLGNTPGHVNHWSSDDFVALLSDHLRVLELRRPFPWTVVLCENHTPVGC